MVSSTIWENINEYLYLIIFIHGNQVSIDDFHRAVSQRQSKLHESEGQVQFEVLKNSQDCMFIQIAQETILLLINNTHEKLCSHMRA